MRKRKSGQPHKGWKAAAKALMLPKAHCVQVGSWYTGKTFFIDADGRVMVIDCAESVNGPHRELSPHDR